MAGRATTDAIFALRQLVEKARELRSQLHMTFVDLEKTYDRVPRQEIWRSMRGKGVPEKYDCSIGAGDVQGSHHSSENQCGKDPRVFCASWPSLSPYLFDLFMDVVGAAVKRPAPWCMLFADDIVLCEPTKDQLEERLESWRKTLEERGLKISRSETEYMVLGNNDGLPLQIEGNQLQPVASFKYLGSSVQRDGINCGWMNWRK
ncbi:uncharacterized protein LOC120351995 [Nilaparvata lugens]|uniref:uncharacterized protein LOC120351995 n=1 Tax=Nilaparvata lugens TaxID=108931 RepID=UPI00193CE565|nr:uncharacterized protein LOC120351995 [Nilaparvata lugens]